MLADVLYLNLSSLLPSFFLSYQFLLPPRLSSLVSSCQYRYICVASQCFFLLYFCLLFFCFLSFPLLFPSLLLLAVLVSIHVLAQQVTFPIVQLLSGHQRTSASSPAPERILPKSFDVAPWSSASYLRQSPHVLPAVAPSPPLSSSPNPAAGGAWGLVSLPSTSQPHRPPPT